MKRIRGMSIQLLRLLLIAGSISILVLFMIHVSVNVIINNQFSGSNLQLRMTETRIKQFAEYVTKNQISATDSASIMNWCRKQPMVLMEIYRDDYLYFNSNNIQADPLSEQGIAAVHYDWYAYYEVVFADGPAEVLVYSDESYILRSWITILEVLFSGLLFLIIVMSGIQKTIHYIYLLCDDVQQIKSGNWTKPVAVKGKNELSILAEELNQMRIALIHHRQKEQEILKQNYDMISGLSHDLRTPLTKLLLYIEIIHNRKYHDEKQLNAYLIRIHEKACQMKEISDNLLEYSITQQESRIETEIVPFRDGFFDLLSELTEYLSEQGFSIACNISWSQTPVKIYTFYLKRIMDNIISNIEKYADKKEPIKIDSLQKEQFLGFSIKNLPRSDMHESGNRIGITNLVFMMKQMDGTCFVKEEDKFYEIVILFPIYE